MIRQLARIVHRFKKAPSRFRSAVTGRFVSKAYAAANPDTTIEEKPRR